MKSVQVKEVEKLFVTKQTLCDMFEISMTFFNDNFQKDMRMESIKYTKGSKFVRYEYEKAKQYMTEILEEITEWLYEEINSIYKNSPPNYHLGGGS